MTSTTHFRVIMLGAGDFALPTFETLLNEGLHVTALITQPDRPQGRKQEIIPSKIKLSALERGIPVHQPESVNAPEGLELVRSLEPDLLVTAAYGQILSADLLAIPSLGGINLHGSILPAYRGAAPVARAIQHGEAETGVTVIRMSPQVDAGGMIAFARTAIDPEETAGELEDRLALLGAPLVVDVIKSIQKGTAKVIPQDKSLVSKAPKLRKEDGLIDWSQPAQTIHDLIRAMQPWPSASTTCLIPNRDKPLRLLIHRSKVAEGRGAPGTVLEAKGDRLIVAAGEGAVRLVRLQAEGRKSLDPEEFLRGYPLEGGAFGAN